MPVTLKLTTVGDALGVVLPKDLLAKLQIGEGDRLRVEETPAGLTLSPEPEAADNGHARQMDVARRVMREDRDILRRLAE